MLYIFIPYNRLSGRIQTLWYSVTKQEGEGWKNIVLFSATTYPNEITSFFFQVGASLGMLLKSLHSKKLYRNWMHKSQLCKAGREHIPDREDTIRRCEGTWWATYNRMIIKRRLWARCSVCTLIPELRDWWLPQVWDQLGRPSEPCLRTQHRHQTRWWRRLEMN